MFTGIIEEVGTLKGIRHGQKSSVVTVGGKKVLADTKIGDSISTNGICLTVTKLHKDAFDADVMPETLQRSNLGALQIGGRVNLERLCNSKPDWADTSSADTSTVPARSRNTARTIMPSGSPSRPIRNCSATSSKKARSPSTASA